MAKRRKGNHEEVMLIPFLDILCSLIGILVLIIVVLCVANTQQTNGRTPEEEATARKFAELSRQRKSIEKERSEVAAKLAKLDLLTVWVDDVEVDVHDKGVDKLLRMPPVRIPVIDLSLSDG